MDEDDSDDYEEEMFHPTDDQRASLCHIPLRLQQDCKVCTGYHCIDYHVWLGFVQILESSACAYDYFQLSCTMRRKCLYTNC